MKINRWVMYALALALVLTLWIWSPWQNGKQSLEFDNAVDVIAASQEKMDDVKNYKYKTEITVGNQIKVDIDNKVVRDEPNRQLMDFSWSAPNMTGTAAMYAQGETIILYNPLKDSWQVPSEEPTLKPFLGFFWRQVNLVDPVENLLKANVKAKDISVVKNETEQTADTVTVQIIPNENAVSELTKALPPQLIGAELKDLKQLFWISKNNFLVSRYEVRATVSFFGIKTMDFKSVSVPLDYNKTEIVMPKQLTDRLKQMKTP